MCAPMRCGVGDQFAFEQFDGGQRGCDCDGITAESGGVRARDPNP